MTRRLLVASIAVGAATVAGASERTLSPVAAGRESPYERLDISERRITQGPYAASLALVRDDQRGLRLRVGAVLTAARIDVLLRNVKGTYLFRAHFDDVRHGGASPPQP